MQKMSVGDYCMSVGDYCLDDIEWHKNFVFVVEEVLPDDEYALGIIFPYKKPNYIELPIIYLQPISKEEYFQFILEN